MGQENDVWSHLLSSGGSPVARAGDGEGCRIRDQGGDDHVLATRQNSLAPGHLLATLVDGLDSASAGNTVGLVREWLLDVATFVTV